MQDISGIHKRPLPKVEFIQQSNSSINTIATPFPGGSAGGGHAAPVVGVSPPIPGRVISAAWWFEAAAAPLDVSIDKDFIKKSSKQDSTLVRVPILGFGLTAKERKSNSRFPSLA